jgi:uncharacterized protein YraI
MKPMNVMLAALASTVAVSFAVPALARPALLVGTQSGSRVNVRSAPTVRSSSPHYGLVGDRVEILNEAQGRDGYVWCYVRFYTSGAEGWIRGDFVRYL